MYKGTEMKALLRNRILLSGRGLYFGTCKLDLLEEGMGDVEI